MFFPPSFYGTFEAAPVGSTDWREITTAIVKSGISEPQSHVTFLSDEMAYVFLSATFAVTTDAGRSWVVWDARDTPRDLQLNYRVPHIRSASISSDGRGAMVVIERYVSMAYFSEDRHATTLRTSDYGRHWTR